MGAQVSRTDFEWSYTEEPHASRRKEILEKHPEIKQLMGHDPNFKWVVIAFMAVQFLIMYLIKDSSFVTLFLCAYFIGGTLNHSLSLAMHEIAHNLAFGHGAPMKNRWFGMFVNLPIGIPASISFKKYHLEHHRYQGDVKWDTDIPSELEAKLFCTTGTKFIWVLLQPLFYAIRPMIIYPKTLSKLEVVNIVVQLTFNALVAHYVGVHMMLYMIGGTLISMGLHPMAGHFISEHYMFKKGYETYSYYGPLNWLTWNVGYHMEHHDFPSVPGSRLPEVKRIAKEYYDHLPQHNSWVKVIYDFIMDPDIGTTSRVKRQHIMNKMQVKEQEHRSVGVNENSKNENTINREHAG